LLAKEDFVVEAGAELPDGVVVAAILTFVELAAVAGKGIVASGAAVVDVGTITGG
jgi:hypothetical protein